MDRMLSTISSDDFINTVVTSKWEINFKDVVARLHQAKDSLDFLALLFNCWALLHVLDEWVFNDLTSTMKEIFDLVVGEEKSINWFCKSPRTKWVQLPCRKIWDSERLGCVGASQGFDDLNSRDFAGSKRPAGLLSIHGWRPSWFSLNSWDETFWRQFSLFNTTTNKKMEFSEKNWRVDVARRARVQRLKT